VKFINKGDSKAVVVKPVLWRQMAYTLFLCITAFFFSMVSYFGVIISWIGTIAFIILGLLNILDQIFEWSRLLINSDGYSYRGWWRKQHYRHEEIESFDSELYAARPLIMVNLKKNAQSNRGLKDEPIAFHCSFGRPAEDILRILKENLDKTPKKRRNVSKGDKE
jgi:hypothetical protein